MQFGVIVHFTEQHDRVAAQPRLPARLLTRRNAASGRREQRQARRRSQRAPAAAVGQMVHGIIHFRVPRRAGWSHGTFSTAADRGLSKPPEPT